MDTTDKFITLCDVKIEDVWGLCAGGFVYEGCNVLLSDGRPCTLGKNARRLRVVNPDSPAGPGKNAPHGLRVVNRDSPAGSHSRGRSDHTCCKVGAGEYMYCFAVQAGDAIIQVNEEVGTKLMGMSGHAFKANFGTSKELINDLCTEVKRSAWTFTCIEKIGGDGYVSHSAVNVVISRPRTRVQVSSFCDGGSMLKPSPSTLDRVCRQDNGQRPLQKLGCALFYSQEIVDSLKSFSVNHE